MTITFKKCDFCEVTYRSDEELFQQFGKLTEASGGILDICPVCIPYTRISDE